jgi:predicted nucleotidyltransferase
MRFSTRLDSLQRKAFQFAKLLKETANIPWAAIGISGSIMLGIHMPSSDIDPIIYGSNNCKKVLSALQELLDKTQGSLEHYNEKDLKMLFDFRSKDTQMNFEDFERTESRKLMQGKFEGTDYFVRFVKDWNELDEEYGEIQYKNLGPAKIEATVTDDSESIFTPCTYEVENVKVVEGIRSEKINLIASFRGRFCEQARKGDVVVAKGKVEQIKDRRDNSEHFRLLVGGSVTDYIIQKS